MRTCIAIGNHLQECFVNLGRKKSKNSVLKTGIHLYRHSAIFIFILAFILFYAGCKKDQPIPAKLQGYWGLVKTFNVAFQTTKTNLSGNCLHFTDKEWSPSCKTGGKSSGRRYLFTPEESNPINGTIVFHGRKLDPDTYAITWSGDTLIMTPPTPVNDIKYYLPQ